MTRKQAEILRNYYSHINRAYRIDYADKTLAIACEKVSKEDGYCNNYPDCKGCKFKEAHEKAISEINNGLRDYMNIEDQIVDNAFVDYLKVITKRLRSVIKSGTQFYVYSDTRSWHWANEEEFRKLMRTPHRNRFVFYDKQTAENIAEFSLGGGHIAYSVYEF